MQLHTVGFSVKSSPRTFCSPTTVTSWAQSQNACQIRYQGANLISIHSDADRRFVSTLDTGVNWIGLHQNQQGGFEWVDGTGLDYTSWLPNAGSKEDCATINAQGYWQDFNCDNWAYAFCRKPAEHSFCKLDPDMRDECGYPGISGGECINFGCCWNPTQPDSKWCYHPSNSVTCLNEGGKCIPKSNANNCNRGIKDRHCENEGTSGVDQVCCINCTTKDCKEQESEWAREDTDCVLQSGTCQYTSMPCTKSGFAYRGEYFCGGPAERQCCAPAVKPTTTVVYTPETMPPTFSPATTPGSNTNAGQTAGIVIGVLVACCALFGGYYFKQNGTPFSTDQQSFNNLNNTNNSDGVVDGISNPLDATQGGDEDAEIMAQAQITEVIVDPTELHIPFQEFAESSSISSINEKDNVYVL